MTQSNEIPVVVFTYNRPDLLEQLLQSLKNDNISLLYVFCDAAKNQEDNIKVKEVYDLVDKIDWCHVVSQKHKHNLGLGKSIKFGVASVLEKYNSAIFFEDDLVCVQGTYLYLSAALRYYENQESVMSVTGWTHPRIIPSDVGNMPYFDGKSECWGWGTWSRAWKGMDMSALEIYEKCRSIGIDVEKYGSDMPKMALEAERRNLWAIGWWYLHLLNNGLCLRPPRSLIETTGWDGRGTTIMPEMKVWANPPLDECPPIPLPFPEPVEHKDCPRLWRTAIDGNK